MPSPSLRACQTRIFASTWLAYAGYYFCRKAFYVAKAKGGIGDALALSSVELAHIGTGYLAGYAVGQFASAWLGRRLGPKLLLLVGMGLSLLCNVAFGVSNGFWTVALFMVLNGMAQGTGWPGCIGSLGHWFRRESRGSVLGLWSTCYQVGSIVATAFAAWLLSVWGWRFSFFGASTVLLAVWLLVLLLHPDTPEKVGLEPVSDDPEPQPRGKQPLPQSNGLGWTRDVAVAIAIMGGIYFCIKFLRYSLWSWTPFLLSQSFGIEKGNAGYLSTIFDACGFVGVLLSGVLSDRLWKGRRSLISLWMMTGMTLSFGAMYLWGASSVTGFAICLGFCGFMLYGPDALLSGVGAIDVGTARGAMVAAGIINGMGSIGPIFEEQIIGWMYEAFDHRLQPILTMFVVVSFAGMLAMGALHLRARAGRARL